MIGWPALELQEAVKTATSVIIRTEIGSQSPWWIRSEYSLVNLQLPLRGLLVATIRQETPRSSSSGMDPRNRGRSRKIIMLHLSLFFFSFTSRAGSSQLVLVTRDSTPAFYIPAALLPQAVVLFRQMAHCILDRPVIDQPPPSKLCHAASLFSTQSSIALYGSTELG